MIARRVLLALCVLALGLQGVHAVKRWVRPIDDPHARYLRRFEGVRELVKDETRIGYVGDAVNMPGLAQDESTAILLAQHALLPIVLTRDLRAVAHVLVNRHAERGEMPDGFVLEHELASGVVLAVRER